MVEREEWVTVSEAARILGVSAETIRRYIDRGLIRARRLPLGHRRVLRGDVEELRRRGDREF